jgi:ABC-type nitrate/sulfonate/bicarbonate transport system substrate-binding protein
MTRLKIGGVPEHFNLPWRLAMEEGDFKANDISLHWEDMGGGTGQMVRGLENKALDVAVLLTEGITKSILQGLDAKIVQVYVTSPLHWGIHVPYKSSIKEVSDLEGQTFAISREGSGSHLMSYVLADEKGWDIKALDFKVIGDVYGGLWALENNEAQAFLWEKFTTQPYTEQEKCRYIDEVVTPWPCFAIAVRTEVWEEHEDAINQMCEVINAKAQKLKNNSNAEEIIAWRYGLKKEDVRSWLKDTEWNYNGEEYPEAFEKAVEYLKRLDLISEEEADGYESKLFAHKNRVHG